MFNNSYGFQSQYSNQIIVNFDLLKLMISTFN